jgi:tRNA G46 methylase TrmB
VKSFLKNYKKESNLIYISNSRDGYWSNLSKKQNARLISLLGKFSVRKCIQKTQPRFEEVIFSNKRSVGLELLKLNGAEVALDLGCMWGALTIPLAKQTKFVIGIDQTIESLKFSEARAIQENLKNVNFLCANLRDVNLPFNFFDVALINGVLEWIPEFEPVEVDNYWHGKSFSAPGESPGAIQLNFLKKVANSLKKNGQLMLAIENRYDYKMFFGEKDPHTGTYLTTIVPRFIANLISKLFKKREYRPWIYSFKELEILLKKSGFKSVELYSCWPDYRFPDYICPYGRRNPYFKPISARKNGKLGFRRFVANRIEWFLFSKLNLQFFAPSIIAIAKK